MSGCALEIEPRESLGRVCVFAHFNIQSKPQTKHKNFKQEEEEADREFDSTVPYNLKK